MNHHPTRYALTATFTAVAALMAGCGGGGGGGDDAAPPPPAAPIMRITSKSMLRRVIT